MRSSARNATKVRAHACRARANGKDFELPAITLRSFRLSEAHFDDVPAVVYDFSEFSAHVGLKIDGLIGFPALPRHAAHPRLPGATAGNRAQPGGSRRRRFKQPRTSVIPYNRDQATPLVPVQMGNESFFVLLDPAATSGSR